MELSLSPDPVYQRESGTAYCGDCRELLSELPDNSVDAVVTSPPFGLADPLEYGNPKAEEYLDWFYPVAVELCRVAKPTGSIIIEIAGGWERDRPIRSTYQHTLPGLFVGSTELSVTRLDERGDESNSAIYDVPSTATTTSPDKRAELVTKFTWYNPGANPTDSQEYVRNRKTRVRNMANPVYWFTPTGGDPTETHPPLTAPVSGPRTVDVPDSAWGLSERDPDTLPSTVEPGDLNIPGNFYAQVSDLNQPPQERSLDPLPPLASLRDCDTATFTQARGTLRQLLRVKLSRALSGTPLPENPPTPETLGIDPTALTGPLKQYCDPAPLEGADLLSYYYLLQTLLEREPATLSISNTVSNSKYLKLCRETDHDPHPARFPRQLVEYIIPRVTRPGDVISDPFAGSNMVGRVAASHDRQWLAFDINREYLETSELRFKDAAVVTQQADPNQTAVSEFGTPR